MIFTVTLNTSVDVSIEVPAFVENSVINAGSPITLPSGKGINVARTLKALGEPVMALGLVGEYSRALFSRLRAGGLQTDFVSVGGFTRQNITIVQRQSGGSTHIRGVGFAADRQGLRELGHRLQKRVRSGDIVAFSGSLPPRAAETTYLLLARGCIRRGALIAMDAADAPMRKTLGARPDVVRLNKAEFISTFRLPEDLEDSEIPAAMASVLKRGVSLLAVSLGSRGVVVVRRGDLVAIRGRLPLGDEFAGRKVVGSGDAMFAGLLYGLKNRLEYLDTIRLALACGAANVLAGRAHPPDGKMIRRLSRRAELEAAPCS